MVCGKIILFETRGMGEIKQKIQKQKRTNDDIDC